MASAQQEPSRKLASAPQSYGPDFEVKQTSEDSYDHDNRHWHGKELKFPRQTRRTNNDVYYNNTSTPKAKTKSEIKIQQLDLCEELRGVQKRLEVCHQDLSSNYMKNIVREIDVSKSSNADQVVALKELFQRLTTEMVHLRTMLSHHSEMTGLEGHSQESHVATKCNSPHVESTVSLKINDLIHLKGPLTENRVLTMLEERFNAGCYQSNIGPVLVSFNPFGCSEEEVQDKTNDNLFLKTIVTQSLQQLFEAQTSQMLILSGESGSGKSFTAQMLIQQLLHVTCAGIQTDFAKQLIASVTVLRSLGKAKTTNNADSSRVAKLYEFSFTNHIISKTKIQCYPLDMSRIVRPRGGERNFHIFYQLFAGLSPKDRAKLQLQTHSGYELNYLYNYPVEDQTEIEILRKQFQSWKLALLVLGIPFSDVTRVLAAILLLGNVEFTEKDPGVLEVEGGDFELKAVGFLLGVPYLSLFRGLTTRSEIIRGERTVVQCIASQATCSRDALSKTLYSRTLSAIVRRCNCSRKSVSSQESSPCSSSESLSKTSNGLSQRSNEAAHLNLSADSTVINTSLNKTSDEVIGIADLFGFENTRCNGMEQICTNLCSETIHHFYTAHIFKSAEGYCREEGLQNEVDVDFVDNTLCIELLTCQGTGILTYLDLETLNIDNGSPETFMDKLSRKHSAHEKFFTSNCENLEFGVVHHSAEVVYNAKELFLSNDDAIIDDVIRIFSKQHCNFGFVTHLFANDLKSTLCPEKAVDEGDFLHRLSPSGTDMTQSRQSVALPARVPTFSQDFQGKLDGLLKTLVQAKPWFILCIKSNREEKIGVFEREFVLNQTRSLQVFETVYLLRSGYTHRMRVLPFAQRYFAFNDGQLTQDEALDIVKSYQKMVIEERKKNPNNILYLGRKHVFFSEVMWQDLERDRREKEIAAENWRQRRYEDEETLLLTQKLGIENMSAGSCEELRETQGVLPEIDMTTPPPIPKRRSYTVIDNRKVKFPQTRIMRDSYRDVINGQEVVFNYGETVKVIGTSPKPGFLTVETKDKTAWVPYKLTKLMSDS